MTTAAIADALGYCFFFFSYLCLLCRVINERAPGRAELIVRHIGAEYNCRCCQRID
jgi:hypothetical protein